MDIDRFHHLVGQKASQEPLEDKIERPKLLIAIFRGLPPCSEKESFLKAFAVCLPINQGWEHRSMMMSCKMSIGQIYQYNVRGKDYRSHRKGMPFFLLFRQAGKEKELAHSIELDA